MSESYLRDPRSDVEDWNREDALRVPEPENDWTDKHVTLVKPGSGRYERGPAPDKAGEMASELAHVRAHLGQYSGSLDILRDILRAFLQELPAKIEALEDALSARDSTRAQGLAHSLANAALAVRASRSGNLALAVEFASRDGLWDQAQASLAAYHTNMRYIMPQLENALQEMTKV